MSVKIIMYGTHKRDNFLLKNKAELGLSDKDITYDDRPNGGGVLYTCEKAWRSVQDCEEEWVCALQDDVEVCDDFQEKINEIADFLKEAFVSFITFDNRQETLYEHYKNSYYKTYFLYGPAIMMPTKYIKECFDWIDEHHKDDFETFPDDKAISDFAIYKGIPLIQTHPSLIQHLGDNSLLNHNVIRRSSYYKKDINFKVKSEIGKQIRIDPMMRKWFDKFSAKKFGLKKGKKHE